MLSRLGATVLTLPVALYIRQQRNWLDRSADPLAQTARDFMQAYFPSGVLESVRVKIANPLPIPDPPFTRAIRRLGFDFPRPSLTQAITFDHIIVVKERLGCPFGKMACGRKFQSRIGDFRVTMVLLGFAGMGYAVEQ